MIYLQALLDGILLGGLYSTIAVGLSLAYGVMGIVNWAHGEFLMMGMFFSFILITSLGIDPYLTLFVNIVVMFLIGYLLQRNVFAKILKRDKDKEPTSVLVATSGLGLAMVSIATMIFGSTAIAPQTAYTGQTLWLGDIVLSVPRAISFVLAIAATIALYFFLQENRTGDAH